MKQKLFLTSIILISFVMVFSCKQKSKEEEKQSICDFQNKFSLHISDYFYGMKDTLKLDISDFNVKYFEYEFENDSTVTLHLFNYSPEEKKELEESDVQINVELYARKGMKIQKGEYLYHEYENGLWSRVTISTIYGVVWFNWSVGMPKQGGVTIDYIDEKNICGNFDLNVDNPDSEMIGRVSLKGPFSIKQ